MLLAETLPEMSDELAALLRQKRRPDLADQVPYLSIVDRCRCGDEFCASLSTQTQTEGQYGPFHDCMDLDAAEGMLLIDTVAEKAS